MSADAHLHLTTLQGIINRMAGNSSACKTWCVTLVSAIVVLVVDRNKPSLAFVTLTPSLVLMVLDAYYLALEREFRAQYSSVVKALHGGPAVPGGFLSIAAPDVGFTKLLSALFSWSVLPLYAVLIAIGLATGKLFF